MLVNLEIKKIEGDSRRRSREASPRRLDLKKGKKRVMHRYEQNSWRRVNEMHREREEQEQERALCLTRKNSKVVFSEEVVTTRKKNNIKESLSRSPSPPPPSLIPTYLPENDS